MIREGKIPDLPKPYSSHLGQVVKAMLRQNVSIPSQRRRQSPLDEIFAYYLPPQYGSRKSDQTPRRSKALIRSSCRFVLSNCERRACPVVNVSERQECAG